ncbi:rCG35963, partial [Rattus norvegicus]
MWNLLHKFVIHFFLVNLCLVVGCQPRPFQWVKTQFSLPASSEPSQGNSSRCL